MAYRLILVGILFYVTVLVYPESLTAAIDILRSIFSGTFNALPNIAKALPTFLAAIVAILVLFK